MFTDYSALMSTGTSLWHGQYAGLYSLPAVGWFALWRLLPQNIGAWLWTALSILALAAVFRHGSLLWLFYAPILECLMLGQIDLWFLWLASRRKPIAWALMTLKPQLFLFALPDLIADRSAWKPFVAWCGVLYLPITLVRPTWPLEWLRLMDDGRLAGHSAMTLIYAPVVVTFAALVILAVTHRLNYQTIIASFNPFLRQYDLTMIAGKVTAWAVPLSWIVYFVGYRYLLLWPMALLGLLPPRHKNRQPARSPAFAPFGI